MQKWLVGTDSYLQPWILLPPVEKYSKYFYQGLVLNV